ncbi:MAG: FeoB small GTPase domain-containing protein, partial [Planctomycetaceae bacterium]
MTTPLVVALIGNPNTGRCPLCYALSGARARSGYFPGGTVERSSGRSRFG